MRRRRPAPPAALSIQGGAAGDNSRGHVAFQARFLGQTVREIAQPVSEAGQRRGRAAGALLLRRRRRLSYGGRANHGEAMLPDFRFLIGAVLATGMLGVAGFGLATAVRLSHEARVGPTDATQSLAFNDRADWNQFSHPEL